MEHRKVDILGMVREWEELFMKLYNRKPKMIEREQFFIGWAYGVRSMDVVINR